MGPDCQRGVDGAWHTAQVLAQQSDMLVGISPPSAAYRLNRVRDLRGARQRLTSLCIQNSLNVR